MRDNIKDRLYFDEYIFKSIERHKRGEEKLESGSVKPNRIAPARIMMISNLLQRVKAKYSAGLPVEKLEDELKKTIELTTIFWANQRKFTGKNGELLNQYSLDTYDEMLWMLSLGYLLDIPFEQFQQLTDVIDEDKVKDKLFEFIISAKIASRAKLKQESYKYGWELFGKLREATEVEDKSKSESLVKTFLEKNWYKEHKNTGWYDNHKSKHGTYSGYWSFETAAVTCIMGLDDSSYRDNEYYPKDLADHYRANHLS